jgi:DNA-binding transcriptional ArsR family regulator
MTNALRHSAVFSALGDPTRRDIFERLGSGPQSVGALASQLPISRPAVSQHLAVLKAAGLVRDSRQGAKNIYALDPRGIAAMRDWLDDHWHRVTQSFAQFVEAQEQEMDDPK